MKTILFILLLSSCVSTTTITVQKDNHSHYATYRNYENGEWTYTIAYTGTTEVPIKKVIEDYKPLILNTNDKSTEINTEQHSDN